MTDFFSGCCFCKLRWPTGLTVFALLRLAKDFLGVSDRSLVFLQLKQVQELPQQELAWEKEETFLIHDNEFTVRKFLLAMKHSQ